MKNIIFSFVIIIATGLSSIAQKNFQGVATYESKTSTAEFKKRFEGNKDMTPEMQKMIEERMKKMFEKTFVLNFDKTSSLYKEEEKLDATGQSGGMGRMMTSMMGAGGTYYKDVKSKSFTDYREFMGKEFLIKDSLQTLKWKMESETRVIGGYNCFKATAIKIASKSDFKSMRLKKENKDAPKVEDKDKKTNFMDEIETPKEIIVTAWYAPEIPVNQGPEGYWGLPGLILEVNDGQTTILCSKVVLNPKEKAEIKAPTSGTVTNQKDFDETVMKKLKEVQEMRQSQGGNGRPQMGFGR